MARRTASTAQSSTALEMGDMREGETQKKRTTKVKGKERERERGMAGCQGQGSRPQQRLRRLPADGRSRMDEAGVHDATQRARCVELGFRRGGENGLGPGGERLWNVALFCRSFGEEPFSRFVYFWGGCCCWRLASRVCLSVCTRVP